MDKASSLNHQRSDLAGEAGTSQPIDQSQNDLAGEAWTSQYLDQSQVGVRAENNGVVRVKAF